MSQFLFVSVPEDEAAGGQRHFGSDARAHVTRHRNTRLNSHTPMIQLHTWTADSRRAPKRFRKRETSSSAGDKFRTRATTTIQDLSHGHDRGNPQTSSSDEFSTPENSIDCICRILPGTQYRDPFWTYPVTPRASFAPIITHYVYNIAVENPNLDEVSQQCVLRNRWFPLAMTQPATMYAVLLMAAAHYSVIHPGLIARTELLEIKAKALSEINSALNDQSYALSDAIIGAVMKMAAFEAVFGSSTVYEAHMSGLQRMVSLRGGLGRLGLGGLLERMVVWIDVNAAYLTGLHRITGGQALPTSVKSGVLDQRRFTGMATPG